VGKQWPPIWVLYVVCGGCGEVTAHTSFQLTSVETGAVVTAHGGASTATLSEIVCHSCGYAQPRTVNDEVTCDVTLVCAGRSGWRNGRRRCGRVFTAPAAAPWPLCPWCSTVQR
jgi:hypothetical protein